MSSNSENRRKSWESNRHLVEHMREATLASQIAFVMTELETSITFCEIALSSEDPNRKTRNIDNALKGYQTALRFAELPERNFKDNPQFEQTLAKLKRMLHKLGQTI